MASAELEHELNESIIQDASGKVRNNSNLLMVVR